MLEDYQLVYIVLELIIACLAVAGNTLVCWSVCINSNLQSITNFFVVSLAVADIAVGLLAIPFAITISVGFCANFYGCLFIACFVLVLTQSSIFSLLAIAVDRYIAIKNPLRYTSVVTGQRAKSFIALCWVLSVVIGLTPMMGWNSGEGSNSTNPVNSLEPSCPEGLTKCLFEGVVTMNYMIYFNFFGCVLLPLMVMLAIYIHIFFAARRQLRLMSLKVSHTPVHRVKTPPLSASRSILQKEVHAAKSLAIIVGLFAVCWLPLHIINCVNHLCRDCKRPDIWVMNIAIILSHANSVVNPLIYAYRIREFRQTFRKILYQHVLGKRNERRISCSIDGTVAGSNSIIWTCSRVSKEASSCETVVNNFVREHNPDLTSSKGSHELEFQWTTNLDPVPSSHILNGLQIKTKAAAAAQQQQDRSSQCAGESAQRVGGAAQVLDMNQQGSSLAFVNLPALSLHPTGFGQSTTLPEIS